ncbi:MAG: hypothetical protein NZ703_03220 [Gemmataceae bacterium]|nr:hypothetical protein [Gemmataceae bacterium]MCS7270074.1 hypothetical protein [Gemmataceae bacterium]MDW8241940.1 hypothetical protein [Thermogemmata sp.]
MRPQPGGIRRSVSKVARHCQMGIVAGAIGLVAVILAWQPLQAEQIHRHQFSGRQTAWQRGEANVRADVLEHDISRLAFHSQPSSEHIRLTADAASGETAYIHFYYDTPPALVTELLSATVWVKATRGGIQLRARVVFPKEPDPANPQTPLTLLLQGETYPAERTRRWWPLKLQDVPRLLSRQLPILQARIGRTVNIQGAYIDRLVLNLYTGPGPLEVWIDDLDIGPVQEQRRPSPGYAPTAGTPFHRQARARQVEQSGGQLLVDGKPFFFRAIRHTGTPLHVLRQAGFDTLWLPPQTEAELLAEAEREGWLVIATIPLAPARDDEKEQLPGTELVSTDWAPLLRRFSEADVLFYDLGGGRSRTDYARVERTHQALRTLDPRRPQGVDVWDSFAGYSALLDVIGAHRWPLFTSLGLSGYRDWLMQRRELTAHRAVFWTWIQNHLPEWYLQAVLEGATEQTLMQTPLPWGPQPEQVRLLAYIALACGCQGLGFWSDRFLADSYQGRDRLQALAILNSELDMLSPVLLAPRDSQRPQWLPTSHPHVQAALIRSERGVILLPIWFGPAAQYVPEQGAVATLTVVVPLVPEGADPWRLSPAGVECLAHQTKKVVGGTELTLHEFDLVTPVVFTSDRLGLVAWWQDYVRKYGRLAARWALDQAAVSYEKVQRVHQLLLSQGVHLRDSDELLLQAARFHAEARRHFSAELYDKAFRDAQRSLRPLRVLMHAHWRQAVHTLDTPTASPYAVSFATLPRHWELARTIQNSRWGDNRLSSGQFELSAIPTQGLPVSALPGWSARFGTVDQVEAAAGIVPADTVSHKPSAASPRPVPVPLAGPYKPARLPSSLATGDNGGVPIQLGRGVLRLEIRRIREATATDRASRAPQPSSATPPSLERTFLAVDTPAIALPPGTLVRISGAFCVPQPLSGSPDGLLFYDDAGGEPLALRLTHQPQWKRFHLYRRVPPDGRIGLTVALTAVGVAYCDDLRIEPLLPAEQAAATATAAAESASAADR